VSIDSS